MFKRSWLLLPLLAAFATPAAAQSPLVQTTEQALAQDAAQYAGRHGVSRETALRRLRAQAESIAVTDEIRRVYRGRLAGISIDHAPVFRIRVLLTGSAPVSDRLIRAGGLNVPLVFDTGAGATAEQVVSAIYRHRAAIDRMIDHEGLAHDPRTGALVVVIDGPELRGESAEEAAARIQRVTGVPVRFRMLDASFASDSGVEGGGRVEGESGDDGKRYFCTTGFVVSDGARRGILTAAHCPDRLDYHGDGGARVPLEFVGHWGGQYQDVQVNVGPGIGDPLFRVEGASRPQLGRRAHAQSRAGDTVCHRGEASGYSCSEIELTSYAPPGELCAGLCYPTWVTVTGPTCKGGDSGGPVFLGTTVMGILKGGNYTEQGRCNFYYYMSADYMPPGWSLVLARRGAEAASLPAASDQ